MNDVVFSEESPGRAESEKDEGLTAGLMLRSAREAAGLHVAALAVSMKIPVKKLEALESDRFDLLHDAVFVRALAASVCRTLKIDSAPVLAKLPSNTVPRLNSDKRGINAPFHTASGYSGFSIAALLMKPQGLIVMALLAGITAVFLFPEKKVVDPDSEKSLQVPILSDHSESLPVEKQGVEQAVQQVVQQVVQPPVFVSSGAVDVAANSRTPANSQLEPRQTAASPPSSEINRVAPEPAIPSSGTITFKAKAPSWVKVVDSNGVVQLSKTLAEREVAAVSGAAPLSIVIGRADAVDVEVRGKAFSLTTVAKENVARFEVK
jgi:cytoskeleton protein RodZ